MKKEIVIGTEDKEYLPQRDPRQKKAQGDPSLWEGPGDLFISYPSYMTGERRTLPTFPVSPIVEENTKCSTSSTGNIEESEEERAPIEPVPIADMAFHMNLLRQALLLAGPLSTFKEDPLVYQFAAIEAVEAERVERIDDLLDTLWYWAMEESTTFIDNPSQLAEVEAPEALAFCLFSQRPRLITKALVIIKHMLEHPQTASELCRTVGRYYQYYCDTKDTCHPIRATHASIMSMFASQSSDSKASTSDGNSTDLVSSFSPSSYDSVLFLLAFLLEHYEGLPDLLVAATDVLSCLCRMHRIGAEAVLQSGVIRLVGTAMLTHVDHQTLRRASASFFSYVVDLSRGIPPSSIPSSLSPSDAVDVAPLSSLLCYTEELLFVILQTFTLGWTNSQIRTSCLRFLRVCSAYPPNRLPLVKEKALVLTLKALPELLKSTAPTEEVGSALAIILHLSGFLDDFQWPYVIQYCLAEVFRSRGEVSVLHRGVLLLLFFLGQELRVVSDTPEGIPTADAAACAARPPVGTMEPNGCCGGSTPRFSHPSLPPHEASLLLPSSPFPKHGTATASSLVWSDLIWHSPLGGRRNGHPGSVGRTCSRSSSSPSASSNALVTFLESCSIPLLLIHLADFCFRHPCLPSALSSTSLDDFSDTSDLGSTPTSTGGEQRDGKKVERACKDEDGGEREGKSGIQDPRDDFYKKCPVEEGDTDGKKIVSAVEMDLREAERELGALVKEALQLLWKLKEKAIMY